MKLHGNLTLIDIARLNRNNFLLDNLIIDLSMVTDFHVSLVGLLLEIKSINDFKIIMPENKLLKERLSCLQ